MTFFCFFAKLWFKFGLWKDHINKLGMHRLSMHRVSHPDHISNIRKKGGGGGYKRRLKANYGYYNTDL